MVLVPTASSATAARSPARPSEEVPAGRAAGSRHHPSQGRRRVVAVGADDQLACHGDFWWRAVLGASAVLRL